MSARRTRPARWVGALLAVWGAAALVAAPAHAQNEVSAETASTSTSTATTSFDIPAQDLGEALADFARQSGQEMLYAPSTVAGKTSTAINGRLSRPAAMQQLLDGTGLLFEIHESGSMIIGDEEGIAAYRERMQTSDASLALGAVAPPEEVAVDIASARRSGVEEIIVTGQKREERLQDVPIAISAFTMEDLTRSQIAGGPDLITQVPNMTFSKTNFTGYNIQIRGIGTQAVSATTDPAVAVAMNNATFLSNRFFEQEFYDLERVEVLRGPQGTLYGRNATAGVVNLITNKPEFYGEAMASLDTGNYNSQRWEGMVNLPLVEDAVALRIAGAGTKRDGYATNDITGSPIDGRDLFSTRVSLRIQPNDRINANLIWEHFEEEDDRLRSGKQLCHKDVVTEVGRFPVDYFSTWTAGGQSGSLFAGTQATLSQGCKRGSLYSENAFQTPNGLMLPYYVPLGAIGLPVALDDPYLSTTQSTNLRVIESTIDPVYQASADIGQLQLDIGLTDSLTLTSETAYGVDTSYSLQDFNRFNTAPGAWRTTGGGAVGAVENGVLDENGVFCDPQLGCSDRLIGVDIASSESDQFSQELRLASDFDGPFNFSLGANYLRFDTEVKYQVFFNSISLIAASNAYGGSATNPPPTGPYVPNQTDNSGCLVDGYAFGNPGGVYSVQGCTYMDPNPIENTNHQGHNYFLSRNPYELRSYALFGETYYNLTEALKLTAGLRWSVDEKTAPRIPTWILVTNTFGYPVAEVDRQEWKEPTGRLVLDWKPNLSFTDETLLYGSYSRGYKAGGANPPGFVRSFYSESEAAESSTLVSATRPKIFDAEYVNAFELGSKNTLLDGRLTTNLSAFYYDYTDYQVSEIVDRSAFNRNFDAEVWGAEIEMEWYALENLILGFKGGYQKTRIADGERAVDLMDRTAGGKHFTITDALNPNFDPSLEPRPRSEYVASNDPNDLPADQEFFAFEDWELVRPFPTFASSCVLPTFLFIGERTDIPGAPSGGEPFPAVVPVGGVGGGAPGGCEIAYFAGNDPVTELPYVPNPTDGGNISFHPNYPGWDPATAPNNGEGFSKELGGNELPNAPNYTATITADYAIPLSSRWMMNLHTDIHWQSESWWRLFNDNEFGRLDDYFTMNLAAIFIDHVDGWNIMAYIKNVTDETAISGAFLNSDDTGLTTNVFLTEPRLFGLRVSKNWSGESLVGGFGTRRGPGHNFPLTFELGGQIMRVDAPDESIAPSFGDAFTGPLAIFDAAQNEDLGWGDGRELKLTWRPNGGPWALSGEYRFGSVNDSIDGYAQENIEVCLLAGTPFDAYCGDATGLPPLPGAFSGLANSPPISNNAAITVAANEKYRFAEFTLSRELLFSGLKHSTLGIGLRRFQINSDAQVALNGIPEWNIPEGLAFQKGQPGNLATRTLYNADFDVSRDFKGTGPTLRWDASSRLFGNDRSGHVDLDWSLTGGILFGEQKASLAGSEKARVNEYGSISLVGAGTTPPSPSSIEETDIPMSTRTTSANVPIFGASLGLSYRVGGFGISTGYRWERYVDVIDGGFEEHKSYDRTIDGPTAKVSVDFGG